MLILQSSSNTLIGGIFTEIAYNEERTIQIGKNHRVLVNKLAVEK